MQRPHRCLRAVFLGLFVILGAAAMPGQSFGLGDQVLIIPAAAFQPRYPGLTNYAFDNSNDGYLSLPGSTGEFVAPLSIPDGAEIFGFCVDAWGQAGGTGILDVSLRASKLPGVGQDPGIYAVPGAAVIQPVLSGGYQSLCNTLPVSYTFHTAGDVDGLGVRNLAHWIYVYLSQASLGAVRINWRRQVSPAPATPTFGDVPDSDGAFAYIEALVASGVTAGCGGGNYCPDTPLTRRQMAVFLAKALGMHWPQ